MSLPHTVGSFFIDVGENKVKDFRVPVDGMALGAGLDILLNQLAIPCYQMKALAQSVTNLWQF